MWPRSWSRNGWSERHACCAILLVTVGILATRDAWADMLQQMFYSGVHSHMLLAPVAAVWLVYARRLRLRRCRPAGRWIGIAAVSAGLLAYWVGDASSLPLAWHGGALMVVIGCFLLVAGRGVLIQFFPAFLALAFFLPIPEAARVAVISHMQVTTADLSQWFFAPMGMTLDQSGGFLILDGQNVAIDELRNSIRTVFALFVVAFGIAFAFPFRTYARILILLAAPLAAVLCSVLSLVPTVWLYATYPGIWASRCCRATEWLMLCLASLLLLMIPRVLRGALLPVMRYSVARD